jgi:NADH:ubiquinone oxidoreductase subunit 3 (subunit A)
MWVEGIGNARIPFSVKYFLVAILFVLFDRGYLPISNGNFRN